VRSIQIAHPCSRVQFNLDGSPQVDVAPESTTTLDLRLRQIKDVAPQLTNAEWLQRQREQKSFLLNCVGCHTLERVVKSRHDANEWTQVICADQIRAQSPWFCGRSGSPVVRRVSRQQDRHVPTPKPRPLWSIRCRLVDGGMTTDRGVRLDLKIGHTIEYLMPRDTNIRRVFVDNSTDPVTFWTGSNHGAAQSRAAGLTPSGSGGVATAGVRRCDCTGLRARLEFLTWVDV
jgi:hypothetical protein